MAVRSTKETTTKRTRHEPEDLTVKLIKTRITWGPGPRGTGDFGMLLSWGRFFIGGGTCACGVAKCCWWQVLARGGPLSTLLKFKLKWGGAPNFIKGPHPTGEHQSGLLIYICTQS